MAQILSAYGRPKETVSAIMMLYKKKKKKKKKEKKTMAHSPDGAMTSSALLLKFL